MCPLDGSIAGVLVMPTVGVMSPQGSWLPAPDDGTGVPTERCHTTAPVAALSAYTVSCSVAT